MDDDERGRAIRTILRDVDALARGLHERYAADREDASRLVQLDLAALAGTMTAMAFIGRSGFEVGFASMALMAIGVLGLLLAAAILATSYMEGRQEDTIGLGALPGRYLADLDRGDASEIGVLERLVRDKGRLVSRNAAVLVIRRRRRDAGFVLMLFSAFSVLSAIGLIAGGGFIA